MGYPQPDLHSGISCRIIQLILGAILQPKLGQGKEIPWWELSGHTINGPVSTCISLGLPRYTYIYIYIYVSLYRYIYIHRKVFIYLLYDWCFVFLIYIYIYLLLHIYLNMIFRDQIWICNILFVLVYMYIYLYQNIRCILKRLVYMHFLYLYFSVSLYLDIYISIYLYIYVSMYLCIYRPISIYIYIHLVHLRSSFWENTIQFVCPLPKTYVHLYR